MYCGFGSTLEGYASSQAPVVSSTGCCSAWRLMSGDLLRFQRIGAIGAVDFLAGDRRIEAAGHDHLGSPAQDVPIVLVERVENARLDLMHLAAGAVLDRALAGDAVNRLQVVLEIGRASCRERVCQYV